MQDAEPAASDRQHGCFRQQLPRQTPQVRADRVTRGQLARAAARAHDDEVRQVHAADDEHEQDAAPQKIERRLHVTNDVVLQEDDDGAEAGILQNLLELGEPLIVAGIERVHLVANLIDRRARP